MICPTYIFIFRRPCSQILVVENGNITYVAFLEILEHSLNRCIHKDGIYTVVKVRGDGVPLLIYGKIMRPL